MIPFHPPHTLNLAPRAVKVIAAIIALPEGPVTSPEEIRKRRAAGKKEREAGR